MRAPRPTLRRLSLNEWKEIAEKAQAVLFDETGHAEISTVDFALIYATDDELFTYATILEFDKLTAHMQHGGALPNAAGTVTTARGYRETMNYLRANYKRITTRIRGDNAAMLRLALSEGFVINGFSLFNDGCYAQLVWGF